MSYDIKSFRKVKHKEKDYQSFCRMCSFGDSDTKMSIVTKARKHALETEHTVDVYTESWAEFTSHVKD